MLSALDAMLPARTVPDLSSQVYFPLADYRKAAPSPTVIKKAQFGLTPVLSM